MAVFLRHSSPTTTVLADGYTDDALGSKYDNFRASRPYSRESLLSNTSLGSKVRFSQFSFHSRDDGTTIDEDEFRRENKNTLQARVVKMFAGQFSRTNSMEIDESSENILSPPPKSFLGKAKYYYDKYKLHRVSASVVLILYSFFGAWIFYYFEHDYEKEVKLKERVDLRALRNDTFVKIAQMVFRKNGNFEEIFIEYEKRLHKVRLPECLDWDYWGALFYVGTLFTTIGYGNIAPRTALGRAASVIYAIVGIPLVLAILSKCGKWMTTSLSATWQQHRLRIKNKARKLRGKKLQVLESGLQEEETELLESRTIPIWLALLICVVYVCACSSLFLLWETRWTFFTSLYFFCISLSTIGLGDIVPDKPHMFIVMFVLVIVGLSIVSMFISVVQIKMEEWLYHLIKKIQREYTRAIENGEHPSHGELYKRILEKEPAWMQLVGPTIMSTPQTDKLEHTVEKFERLLKESKEIQTEKAGRGMATQVEVAEQSMACDPMSQVVPEDRGTQWSNQLISELAATGSADYRDSISDATSLPLDSLSHKSPQVKKCENFQHLALNYLDGSAQTDLAQFQIDEIAIKLANLQTQRVRPPIVERSMATSAFLDSSESIDNSLGLSQVEINMLTSLCKSASLVDAGVGLDHHLIYMSAANSPICSMAEDRRSFATSPICSIAEDLAPAPRRSFATSPIGERNSVREEETQTVIQARRDQMTSPVIEEPEKKEEEPEKESDDHSQQTSIGEWFFGKLMKRKDSSQQTSQAEDLKVKPTKEENSSSSSLGSNSKALTMSTQYSPPPDSSNRLSEPGRARSSSTSGMGMSIFEEETRQEVIVQTDDSYLKIARRLDEYRNNKTQFLPVCAAAPLASKEVEPFKTDRPSERSHYYFGGRRASLGRSRKKGRSDMMSNSHRESQTGQSMDAELLKEVLMENMEVSRPREHRKKSVNFAEIAV